MLIAVAHVSDHDNIAYYGGIISTGYDRSENDAVYKNLPQNRDLVSAGGIEIGQGDLEKIVLEKNKLKNVALAPARVSSSTLLLEETSSTWGIKIRRTSLAYSHSSNNLSVRRGQCCSRTIILRHSSTNTLSLLWLQNPVGPIFAS
jgi:hypothetical protein